MTLVWGRDAGRGGPWGDARVYFAAPEGPAGFWVFRLVCGVKGGAGEWERGALATFFSLKPENPLPPWRRGRCQGVLSAVGCSRPGRKASPRAAEEGSSASVRDAAGLVGASQAASSQALL